MLRNLPANAGDSRNSDLIPWLGRSPGGGNGNPLQYSCLENPMDRGPGRLQSMESQRVGHNWSNLACTYTTVFKCTVQGIKYIYIFAQLSPLSISRMFSSSQTGTLSPVPLLSPWQPLFCFLSLWIWSPLETSCKWNHTIFILLWLAYFS